MVSVGKILLVEDEPSIREVVALYLRRAGFEVDEAPDGAQGQAALSAGVPDLVILDLMLPHVDGFELARWIRARSEVPMIMLTARRAETDRIAGLEMGADDYVVKPFSPQELVSRVRAVLRRTGRQQSTAEPLVFGDVRIEPSSRVVTVAGEERGLTATEFELLCFLARNPRQVFSRDQLLEHVWGFREHIDPSTVTVHVRRLREKVEEDPSDPRHVLTVWGVGYKLEP
jgi:DNA-binding response OmpR family regulator